MSGIEDADSAGLRWIDYIPIPKEPIENFRISSTSSFRMVTREEHSVS